MRRDILNNKTARQHVVAAFAFVLAATACNDELTEPLVAPAGGGASAFATAAGDRAVLVALYEATNGPDWDNSDNWLTGASLNTWHGVRASESGHVLELTISGNNLTGEIPRELGGLSNLTTLSLRDNNLTGEIPRELGGLSSLTTLSLRDNNLTGEIPRELGGLSSLTTLDLNNNNLTGAIPRELGNLSNLTTLSLQFNDFRGDIPPELGNLSRLISLAIATSGGEIPLELGNLSNLENLYLNDLTGKVPSELGSLTSLREMYLQGNDFTGGLPSDLGELANLEWLAVTNSNLSGEVPHELARSSVLRGLFWSDNAGLCAPGTRSFIDFVQGLERSRGPFCHEAEAAALRSFYHATGGSEWASSSGWLQPGPLADWYGIETDSLSGRVVGIDLTANDLSGVLAGNWASLRALRELRLGGNGRLNGRLASGMTALPLRVLSYEGTKVCIPADPAFRAWLRSVRSHSGTGTECPPLTDRDILETFFYATGGQDWSRSDNWLTDVPLDVWHGVETDASGRVRSLDLWGNDLTGEIPRELGGLANLRELHLLSNDLTGEIPRELGGLANLDWLHLGGNDLTGEIPRELGGLANLRDLFLGGNDLTGEIPRELGGLANLRVLFLWGNDLTGEIPRELGGLANLRVLHLWSNDLTGEIPRELGGLANLDWLHLGGNDLTGEIPRELGGLANLTHLYLSGNDLTGEIPRELGGLANLDWLHLGGNDLTGEIPRELGGLANLTHLYLSGNDLTGEIPRELGGLANLTHLYLSGNADLVGLLPIANWRRLSSLSATGTRLCVGGDFATRLQMRSFWNRYVRICETRTETALATATAYVVQTVQSPDFPVPLVAGRPGLLRVLVAAPDAEGVRVPSGVATFYQQDGSKHSVPLSPGTGAIPAQTEAAERSLDLSTNAAVPGEVLRPGVEIVVVLDPEGALDPQLGVPRRVPEVGRTTLDVYEMPTFDVTVVPFLWETVPDSSILNVTRGLSPEAPLFKETRSWLPVGRMRVTVHEPVWTSTKGWQLGETEAIRVMEGGAGYYMGTMGGVGGGVAYVPGRVMFSTPDGGVVAHEFGHNMHLWHAPCGGAGGPDPGYPHAKGRSGAWGWDHRSRSLVPPNARDVMGYCNWGGISDYHFANALRWRLQDETGIGAALPVRALLLWGGAGADGRPFLNPAFVVEAPPTPLDGTGAWQLAGEAEDGRVLFTRRFEMAETADGDGRQSFALALPTESSWADALSRIVLTGPDGSVAMDAQSGPAAALLRDPATGRVRGILRDWSGSGVRGPAGTDGARGLPEPGLEVQVSRGVPAPAAWRR